MAVVARGGLARELVRRAGWWWLWRGLDLEQFCWDMGGGRKGVVGWGRWIWTDGGSEGVAESGLEMIRIVTPLAPRGDVAGQQR